MWGLLRIFTPAVLIVYKVGRGISMLWPFYLEYSKVFCRFGVMVNPDTLKALILQYFPINRQCKFEEMKLAVRREQLLEALIEYFNTLSE